MVTVIIQLLAQADDVTPVTHPVSEHISKKQQHSAHRTRQGAVNTYASRCTNLVV